MLLGERLGRRHQRPLATGLDRAQERVERDRRLSRADVALEQPLHRRVTGEIAVDLGDRVLLVLGQRERQHLPVARHELAGRGQRLPRRTLDARAQHGQLQREQLVESEPAPRELGLLGIDGKVHRPERIAPDRALALGGQRVEHVVGVQLERRAHQLADPRRRHLLARPVDRCVVGGRARLAEVVRPNLEAVAREAAAQPDAVPGTSLSASHGWLNQLAEIDPVSSRIVAFTIVSRRRGRRTRTDSTTPEIATSSSPQSCEIATSSAAGS